MSGTAAPRKSSTVSHRISARRASRAPRRPLWSRYALDPADAGSILVTGDGPHDHVPSHELTRTARLDTVVDDTIATPMEKLERPVALDRHDRRSLSQPTAGDEAGVGHRSIRDGLDRRRLRRFGRASRRLNLPDAGTVVARERPDRHPLIDEITWTRNLRPLVRDAIAVPEEKLER